MEKQAFLVEITFENSVVQLWLIYAYSEQGIAKRILNRFGEYESFQIRTIM